MNPQRLLAPQLLWSYDLRTGCPTWKAPTSICRSLTMVTVSWNTGFVRSNTIVKTLGFSNAKTILLTAPPYVVLQCNLKRLGYAVGQGGVRPTTWGFQANQSGSEQRLQLLPIFGRHCEFLEEILLHLHFCHRPLRPRNVYGSVVTATSLAYLPTRA
jgi:hypothetical protein